MTLNADASDETREAAGWRSGTGRASRDTDGASEEAQERAIMYFLFHSYRSYRNDLHRCTFDLCFLSFLWHTRPFLMITFLKVLLNVCLEITCILLQKL